MDNLALPFWRATREAPERLALVADTEWSYARAAAQASALAEWLGPSARRVAILASRSSAAFLSVLGCCWGGAAYFPLSLRWPEERLCHLLKQIGPHALLVDDRGQELLSPALRALVSRILHPLRDLSPIEVTPPRPVDSEALAYVLFTSGTTGAPKGVMISVGAVNHLIQRSYEFFPLSPQDRVGCNFELSFDGAVFDMFLAWRAGASLHVVPPAQSMAPVAFMRRQQVTLMLLTPSSLAILKKLKMLQADYLPHLRWSLFGAEALPRPDALRWQEVAPQSKFYSLYGPTENTVTSLLQPLSDPPTITPQRDTIALGRPWQGVGAVIVDEHARQLPPGCVGELALQGAQLALGYFQDDPLTKRRFPVLQGVRSYLTGDRAYQDEQGIFHHLGRTDHQVKVRGHRVELEEIESFLRLATGETQVAALLWPDLPGHLNEIVAFVAGFKKTSAQIQEILRKSLPTYALPAQIHCLEQLPQTENGKLDRMALVAWLKSRD